MHYVTDGTIMRGVKTDAERDKAMADGWRCASATWPEVFTLAYEQHQAYLVDGSGKRLALFGADLSGADLSRANLTRADLSGADLSGAVLSGADLSRANLTRADLSGAVLFGADLFGADLSGAVLSGANLGHGVTWETYLSDVVPALLTAGGKSLDEVVTQGWDCHQWENCPMAVAFGVHSIADMPALYRPRADEFIRFFDAKLIPRPECGAAPSCEASK